MHLTIRRAVFAAIVVQWVIDAFTWTQLSLPTPPWFVGCVLVVHAALYAGIAVLAVRAGRRYSAPLYSAIAALTATVMSSLVGIVTGQFLARGFGPWAVLTWLVALTVLAALSGTIGALVAALQKHRNSSAVTAS